MEDLRVQSGDPSLRTLERLSLQVVADYKEAGLDLRTLSLATLSNQLRPGSPRKKPPPWPWVATFVLTCQRHAVTVGLARSDPGVSTLSQWNVMLQAVFRGGQEGAGRHARPLPGMSTPADGTPQRPLGPSAPEPAPAAEQPRPRQDGANSGDGDALGVRDADPRDGGAGPAAHARGVRAGAGGVDLLARPSQTMQSLKAATEELIQDYVGDPEGDPSLTDQRMFTLYGQAGVRLVRAAEKEDPEACFGLGVLLCVDERPQESLAWLMKAERQGHQSASSMIESLAPVSAATRHAYRLGRRALAAGDKEAAQVFLERAAARRHADAAFQLGSALADDPEQAVQWFKRAADLGHHLAQWWADPPAACPPAPRP
ncbi:tetratricopeptide repeat protein [Actinomadura viridis]|uniref:tetratricopeptide repeat protein n=1 Tax=Actinomadura viridis TaxID=58110 RepID=UPI0036B6EB3B